MSARGYALRVGAVTLSYVLLCLSMSGYGGVEVAWRLICGVALTPWYGRTPDAFAMLVAPGAPGGVRPGLLRRAHDRGCQARANCMALWLGSEMGAERLPEGRASPSPGHVLWPGGGHRDSRSLDGHG